MSHTLRQSWSLLHPWMTLPLKRQRPKEWNPFFLKEIYYQSKIEILFSIPVQLDRKAGRKATTNGVSMSGTTAVFFWKIHILGCEFCKARSIKWAGSYLILIGPNHSFFLQNTKEEEVVSSLQPFSTPAQLRWGGFIQPIHPLPGRGLDWGMDRQLPLKLLWPPFQLSSFWFFRRSWNSFFRMCCKVSLGYFGAFALSMANLSSNAGIPYGLPEPGQELISEWRSRNNSSAECGPKTKTKGGVVREQEVK